MRVLVRIFLAVVLSCPLFAWANPSCSWNPNGGSVTSGCPASFSFATQGSTTPSQAPNTSGYTNPVTGVSAVQGSYSGIYCTYGIPYSSVVGYNAPSGSAQNSQDLTTCAPPQCWPQLGGSSGKCEWFMCIHDGAFFQHGTSVNGCLGDQTIASETILQTEEFLGRPNQVGNLTAIMMVNYRLTAAPVGYGTNSFPAQWQDIKCAMAYPIANSSLFPFATTNMMVYGPSAGASFVFWLTETPDNAYTWSCPGVSAPANDPVYRAAAAWTPLAFYYPVGNSYTFNSTAFQNAVCGLFGQTSCTLSTQEANCSAFSPNCDIGQAVASGSLNASLQKTQIMYQNGTNDLTVISLWNSNNGGNWYRIADAYGQSGSGVHPFAELLQNCGHECTIGNIDGEAQIDAFNFLFASGLGGSSGLGGTL